MKQLTMKSTVTRVLPFAAGALLYACSAPPSVFGTSIENDTAARDDMTLQASSDTASAIGVTHWGATHSGGTTTVHGYDAANDVVVTLTHTVTEVSTSESTIKDSVVGKLGSAVLAVQMTAAEPDANGNIAVTTKVTNNTFEKDSGPSKMLAAALADQSSGANWSEASASTESLHIRDVNLSSSSSGGGSALTQCVGMTVSCVKSIADAVEGGFKAAMSCSGIAKDVSQTVQCATDPNSGKANVAEGGLRGPVLRGAKCTSPSSDQTSTDASSCVQAATDAVKGGADSVNACAQIAGCADGGGTPENTNEQDSGALPPAGS